MPANPDRILTQRHTAAIERLARHLYERYAVFDDTPWNDLTAEQREKWLQAAQEALSAAFAEEVQR
jgi:hypothetical protein